MENKFGFNFFIFLFLIFLDLYNTNQQPDFTVYNNNQNFVDFNFNDNYKKMILNPITKTTNKLISTLKTTTIPTPTTTTSALTNTAAETSNKYNFNNILVSGENTANTPTTFTTNKNVTINLTTPYNFPTTTDFKDSNTATNSLNTLHKLTKAANLLSICSTSNNTITLNTTFTNLLLNNVTTTNTTTTTTTNATATTTTNATTTKRRQPFKLMPRLTIPLYSIIFVLAWLGNVLVVLTVIQHKRMRTITNIYLLNLSVTDILFASVCMPLTLIPTLMQDFVFGFTICVLVRYLQGLWTVLNINKYVNIQNKLIKYKIYKNDIFI